MLDVKNGDVFIVVIQCIIAKWYFFLIETLDISKKSSTFAIAF